MPTVLFVPLSGACGAMNLFDHLPPTDARVVRAEGDFPHFSALRDDAHLGSTEIVRPEILKPHPGHKQKSPWKLVGVAFALPDLATTHADLTDGLANEFPQPVVCGGCIGTEVPDHRSCKAQDLRERDHLLSTLMDQQDRAYSTIRMAPAIQRSNLAARLIHQIDHVTDGSHRAQWKPVAQRSEQPGLVFQIMRQVTKRVAFACALFVGDVLVAASEADWLERDHRDLVRVLDRKLDDLANLGIVDPAHDRDNQHHVDPSRVQILDRSLLDVE